FLYFMAFSFAGKAVAELQEGRLLRLTPVPGGPRLPALGIYPTAESLLAQGVLLLLALVALVWLFLVEPRRRGARAAPGESPPAPAGQGEALPQRRPARWSAGPG